MLASKVNTELVPFNTIKEKIITENSFVSKLSLIDGTPNLQIKGFMDIPISDKNESILKRNGIHSSQQLALFSMAYATDYLIFKTNGGKLTGNDVEILNKTYLFVNSEILNFKSLNNMTVNDHAISERVQFVLLYLSYLSEFEPSQQLVIKKLQKDLNICIGFLIDDDHFTWQTNHGIMQLRAIAQIADFTTDEKLKLQLLDVFEERLRLVIPFFLGDDGAIYESASGYWKYIHSQFVKLTEIESVRNLPIVIQLKNKLIKSSKFIDVVTTNDGYLQGLGDSYSSISKNISLTFNKERIPKNRIFQFSNQIAGFNWTTDSVNSSVLFVSMHTPPNVHKLPDDLALYVYSNGPFFSNTGTYAYGVSKMRSFFESEASQSTVRINKTEHVKPVSSSISGSVIDKSNEKVFVGKKIYQNSDTIVRILKFKNDQSFQLIDFSTSEKELNCSFNLHPAVKIQICNDSTVILTNQNDIELKMISNNKIKLTKGVISDKYNHSTTVDRLEIDGEKIINKFILINPKIEVPKSLLFVNCGSPNENNRLVISKKITDKFRSDDRVKHNFKAVFFKSLFFTLLVYFAAVILIEKNINKSEKSK